MEKEKKIDKNIEDELNEEYNKSKADANILNKEIDKLIPIKKSITNVSLAEDLMDSLDLVEKFKNDVYQYEISVEEYNVI